MKHGSILIQILVACTCLTAGVRQQSIRGKIVAFDPIKHLVGGLSHVINSEDIIIKYWINGEKKFALLHAEKFGSSPFSDEGFDGKKELEFKVRKCQKVSGRNIEFWGSNENPDKIGKFIIVNRDENNDLINVKDLDCFDVLF